MQNRLLQKCVVGMFLLTVQLDADSAAPVLSVTGITNGLVSLRLDGNAGSFYTLEGSTNLTTWFGAGSGSTDAGSLVLTHDGPGRWPSVFYRAVQSSELQTYLTVGVKADTNIATHAVMLPGQPDFFRLEAPNGVRFTLEVPTNALAEATPLTITVITNLSDLPVARGFLAGVRLEPEDVILRAPAFLRIDFRTNLPSSQIASYAFDNSGALFHLQPDLVASNSVRILVSRFGSFGCGIFTLDELEEMAARVPPPVPGFRPLSVLEDCFPAHVQEATALREVLRQKTIPIEQKIAARLARQRQGNTLGEEVFTNAMLAEAFNEGSFIETQLVPRIPNAQMKGRVGEELLIWLLEADRRRQLFDLPSMTNIIPPFMCTVYATMTKEIKECCTIHGGDNRLARDLLGMERRRQVAGLMAKECGVFNYQDLTNCMPAWHGSLTFTESGNSTATDSGPSFRSTSSRLFKYQVEMTVERALETIVPPIPFIGFPGSTNISINLRGDGMGAHQVNEHYQDLFDPCEPGWGGGESLDRYTLRGTRSASEVSVNLEMIIASPGGAIPSPPTSLNFAIPAWVVPQTGSTISTTRAPTAAGCDVETTVDLANQVDPYGQWSFNLPEGEFQHSTNRIFYTAVANRTVESLAVKRTVVLELKRRD